MAIWTTPPRTFNLNEVPTGAEMQLIQDAIDALAPVGSYMLIHGTPAAHATTKVIYGGWLECNGATLSVTDYPALFAVIGGTYTSGGPPSVFSLPDFSGRLPASAAGSGGHSDMTLGGNDGAAFASRRPKHAHTVVDGHTHADSGGATSVAGSHTHNSDYPTYNVGRPGSSRPISTATTAGTTGGPGNHAHDFVGVGMTSTATGITSVGIAGLTDMPGYLVCCIVAVKF